MARQYRESFEVYGTKKSVEWPLIEHEPLVIHTAKLPEPEIPAEVKCPDFAHYLPEEIRAFTTGGVYGGDEGVKFKPHHTGCPPANPLSFSRRAWLVNTLFIVRKPLRLLASIMWRR